MPRWSRNLRAGQVERWVRASTALVAILATLAACSGRASDRARRAPSSPKAPASTSTSTAAAGSAPRLAAGCTTVTYTPPEVAPRLGELCVPAGGKHDVGIVLLHPGGGVSGDRFGMRGWSAHYAAAGYVNLSIDYTLFDDRARPPVFPRPEVDSKTAVQFLRRRAADLGLDPSRIVVHGNSYGARLGAALLVSADSTNDDAGAWAGTSDRIDGLVAFYGPYDGSQPHALVFYGGPRDSPDPAIRARWAASDAVARAAAATGPALICTGAADTLVRPAQAEGFVAALAAGGRDAQLVEVPGAGHLFDDPGAHALAPAGEATASTVQAWMDRHFS